MATYHFATDSCQVEIEAESADAAAREYAEGERIAGVATAADLERRIEELGGWLYMTGEDGAAVATVAK